MMLFLFRQYFSKYKFQDALGELNNQIQAHPSLLPADFDLDPVGHLVLNVPPSAAGVMFEGRTFEADDQRVPVAKLSVSSSSGGDANSPQVNIHLWTYWIELLIAYLRWRVQIWSD